MIFILKSLKCQKRNILVSYVKLSAPLVHLPLKNERLGDFHVFYVAQRIFNFSRVSLHSNTLQPNIIWLTHYFVFSECFILRSVWSTSVWHYSSYFMRMYEYFKVSNILCKYRWVSVNIWVTLCSINYNWNLVWLDTFFRFGIGNSYVKVDTRFVTLNRDWPIS